MSAIEFTWDLGVWAGDLSKPLVRALAKAGSDAARAMRVESSRRIRERKRFKVAAVNRGLPLAFPRNKSDMNSLVWRMGVSGTPVPLITLPHNQTRRGVTVSVNVGVRKLIRGAFIARMQSGHEGIFRRVGKKRLPIVEAFTTRISDVFKDSGFIPTIQDHTRRVFKSSFDRLYALELDKLVKAS